MKMRELREIIKGKRITDVEVVFDDIRYRIEDADIVSRQDKGTPIETLVIRCNRFDEIDESGVIGDDFV